MPCPDRPPPCRSPWTAPGPSRWGSSSPARSASWCSRAPSPGAPGSRAAGRWPATWASRARSPSRPTSSWSPRAGSRPGTAPARSSPRTAGSGGRRSGDRRPPPRPALVRLDAGTPWIDPRHAAGWRRAWREVSAARPPRGYDDARGLPELRAALAGHLARTRGLVVDPDEVVVTGGTTDGLRHLLAALPPGPVARGGPGLPGRGRGRPRVGPDGPRPARGRAPSPTSPGASPPTSRPRTSTRSGR